MSFKSTVCAAAAAVLLIGAGAAEAKTVSLTTEVNGKYYGNEGWARYVDQTVLDRDTEVGARYRGTAGAFRFTDGVSAFIAFCIDPYSYLDLGEVFTVTDNATVIGGIDKLFNAAYSDVQDAASAAAFQVALWEVLSETDTVLDVTKGNHSVRNTDIAVQANEYLSRLASAETGKYRYTIFQNGGQDQISVSEVPLPASFLLLLGGFGGLALLRRKSV